MRSIITLLFIVLFSSPVHAQKNEETDARVAGYMRRINYWAATTDREHRDDSLEKANCVLVAYLLRLGDAQPSSIRATFSKAEKEGLSVVSAPDGQLRLYCWDTRMGGTMRLYQDIVQYATKNGVQCRNMKDSTIAGGDYGFYATAVIAIPAKGGRRAYLIPKHAVVSNKDRYSGIDAYVMEGESLKPFNLFQAGSKLLSSIGYGYDEFASANNLNTRKLINLPDIHLSKDLHTLYIPVVKGETLTDKYLIYKFDGNHFVFDKHAH
jgi:hypothetical protein